MQEFEVPLPQTPAFRYAPELPCYHCNGHCAYKSGGILLEKGSFPFTNSPSIDSEKVLKPLQHSGTGKI